MTKAMTFRPALQTKPSQNVRSSSRLAVKATSWCWLPKFRKVRPIGPAESCWMHTVSRPYQYRSTFFSLRPSFSHQVRSYVDNPLHPLDVTDVVAHA